MDIYDRQKSLSIDYKTTITIVGCGGIGFWVAKMASMVGIEKIYLFDPDVIEIHNMNRMDLTEKSLGKNKADIAKIMINNIRPECTVYSYPFKFSENFPVDTEWLVDCTDSLKSQIENQKIANNKNMKYVKAGYDGESISINDVVGEWGEAEDGYRVVPSFVVPAVIVAALTIAKITKYKKCELGTKIYDLFNFKN